MARDEDREAGRRAERTGGAGGAWTPGERSELAVRDDLAARNGAQGLRQLAAKRRQVTEVELDVREVLGVAGEIPAEPRDETWRESVTAVCALVR